MTNTNLNQAAHAASSKQSATTLINVANLNQAAHAATPEQTTTILTKAVGYGRITAVHNRSAKRNQAATAALLNQTISTIRTASFGRETTTPLDSRSSKSYPLPMTRRASVAKRTKAAASSVEGKTKLHEIASAFALLTNSEKSLLERTIKPRKVMDTIYSLIYSNRRLSRCDGYELDCAIKLLRFCKACRVPYITDTHLRL